MSITKEIEDQMLKLIKADMVHVLAMGENLGSVAAQYKITLEALYKANPNLRMLDPRKLRAGLKIKIPESSMGHAGKLQGKTLDEMIGVAANEFGINAKLFKELMRQETTNFNPKAVSPVGAVGLTQLMPGRVKELGISDPTDPAQSICGGAALLEDYMGRARNVLASNNEQELEFVALLMYNGGPTRVSTWLKNPSVALPSETQNYAVKIFERMGRAIPERFKSLQEQG